MPATHCGVLCTCRCDAGVVEDTGRVLASGARVNSEWALAEGAGIGRTDLSDSGHLFKVGQTFEAGRQLGAVEGGAAHVVRAAKTPASAMKLRASSLTGGPKQEG